MTYGNTEVKRIIMEFIHKKRDREIMLCRLINHVTIERLAEMHDLSVSQTKRIIKENKELIFQHLEQNSVQ